MREGYKFGRQFLSHALSYTLARLTKRHHRQIKVESLFTEYRIQSHSNNEITIEVPTDGLLVALRSAAAPTSGQGSSNVFASAETQVIMKFVIVYYMVRVQQSETTARLAQNQDRKSVLSFEISSTYTMGRTMTVVQQLLVDVARHAVIERLKEPMCPEPDVRACNTFPCPTAER